MFKGPSSVIGISGLCLLASCTSSVDIAHHSYCHSSNGFIILCFKKSQAEAKSDISSQNSFMYAITEGMERRSTLYSICLLSPVTFTNSILGLTKLYGS